MALTKYQVKERLGWGGMKAIAAATGLSKSHVSRVLNEQRPDRRVAVTVARRLRVKLAELPERYYRDVPAATAA